MGTGFQPMDQDTQDAMNRTGKYAQQPGSGGDGVQNSGNMVDNHDQRVWTGGATPGAMQINVGATQHAAGVNAIDPNAARYNNGLAQQYADQAAGRGPSLAQMQLQQGTDATLKGQSAMAASGRNPATASYNAMQNAGAATQQQAGQAAQARLAEQYQAQQGLAGLTNQMQNAYGANAQMSLQNNQFNAGADNARTAQQASIDQGQNQAYNGMRADQQRQYNQYQNQHDLNEQQSNNELRNGLVKTGVEAVGGAASAVSDENQKTDVQGGGSTLQSFLDRLKSQQHGAAGSTDGGGGAGWNSGRQMGQSFVQNLQKSLSAAPPSASPGASTPQFSTGGMGEGGPMMSSAAPAAGGFSEGSGALASGIAGNASAAPLSSMLAVSDRQMKTSVKDGSGPTGSFLDRLKAHEYRYKHPEIPGAGEGRYVSVMAQELEKAGPVGESMVKDTPNGKTVDYGKGFATMLAAQTDLHHRLKKLENGR